MQGWERWPANEARVVSYGLWTLPLNASLERGSARRAVLAYPAGGPSKHDQHARPKSGQSRKLAYEILDAATGY